MLVRWSILLALVMPLAFMAAARAFICCCIALAFSSCWDAGAGPIDSAPPSGAVPPAARGVCGDDDDAAAAEPPPEEAPPPPPVAAPAGPPLRSEAGAEASAAAPLPPVAGGGDVPLRASAALANCSGVVVPSSGIDVSFPMLC